MGSGGTDDLIKHWKILKGTNLLEAKKKAKQSSKRRRIR
jgi:hypothetical protein